MDLPPLTYVTFDEVGRGVGASQVVPYVERLCAVGLPVTLHSYEQRSPREATGRRLRAAGVEWHPHRFKAGGTRSAVRRVADATRFLRGAELVHARSDLPAAAAVLARSDAWVWDIRSFWIDQRIALGLVSRGAVSERVMRRVEASAARRAPAITTLTDAAIEMLVDRHGPEVRAKATVVPTCVDLRRFVSTPMPASELTLMLNGTYNALYDDRTTFAFIEEVRRRGPARLLFARPDRAAWDDRVVAAGGALLSAPYEAMPELLAQAHAGLCICRADDRAALVAAAPTKIAEFLATGRPVVVNRGLGDMDHHIASAHCGVVLDSDIEAAADELLALVQDPATPERCRRLAEEIFSLDAAIPRLLATYRRAVDGNGRNADWRRHRPEAGP